MLAGTVQMISVMLMNIGRMPRGPSKIIWNRTDWPVFQNGQKQIRGALFAAATLRGFGAIGWPFCIVCSDVLLCTKISAHRQPKNDAGTVRFVHYPQWAWPRFAAQWHVFVGMHITELRADASFSRISSAGANAQIIDTLALTPMGRHGWLHGWLTRCQQIWLVYGPVYESCGCA